MAFNKTYGGPISQHSTVDLTEYPQDMAAAMYVIAREARSNNVDYVGQAWARQSGIGREVVKMLRQHKLVTEEFNNGPMLHLSRWPAENDEHEQEVCGAAQARRAATLSNRPDPLRRGR